MIPRSIQTFRPRRFPSKPLQKSSVLKTCWCSFFQSSRAYKKCASRRRFFRGPYGVHPRLKTLIVVVFFNGGGGVGILLSSFFLRGAWCHSQIHFVVAFVFMDTVSSSDGGDLTWVQMCYGCRQFDRCDAPVNAVPAMRHGAMRHEAM